MKLSNRNQWQGNGRLENSFSVWKFSCPNTLKNRIELGLIAWVTLEFETFCFITAYIYILKCSSANFLSFIPQIFSLTPYCELMFAPVCLFFFLFIVL